MNPYHIRILIYVAGSISALTTFIHRLCLSLQGKLTRVAYRCGGYSISLTLAGIIDVWFCFLLNEEKLGLSISADKIKILFIVSGLTMFSGILLLIMYYIIIYLSSRKESHNVY